MVAIVTAGLLLLRECDTQRGVSAEAHASGFPYAARPRHRAEPRHDDARRAGRGDAAGETATGRDAIAARAKLYVDAFPDMRLDIESIEVDGDRFTLEWKASGTNTGSLAGIPATNRSVVVEGCDGGEVGDDGLIRRETDYWNEASMMRQLGLVPEPSAAV